MCRVFQLLRLVLATCAPLVVLAADPMEPARPLTLRVDVQNAAAACLAPMTLRVDAPPTLDKLHELIRSALVDALGGQQSGAEAPEIDVELYDARAQQFRALTSLEQLRPLRRARVNVAIRASESVSGSSSTRLALPAKLFDATSAFEIRGVVVSVGEVGNSGKGTGLTTWDGSVVLAKHLEHARAGELRGKRVLEVGAGTGLAGLSAALLGAREVVLTDLAYTMENLAGNAAHTLANARHAGVAVGAVHTQVLDWFAPPTDVGALDFVLAADVVWVEELIAPLVRTLATLLRHSPTPATVVMAHQTRSAAADVLLFAELARHALARRVVPASALHPRFVSARIAVRVEPLARAAAAAPPPASAAAVAVGDLSAAVPGKPFLVALAAAFDELEQPASGAAGDARRRRRTRRLSSARSDVAAAVSCNSSNSSSHSDGDARQDDFVLRLNAQCLFYLQGLFQAMLTPTTSECGLVTQWRVNALFLDGLEDATKSDLGPASPAKILTLGGHLLEQTALIVSGASADDARFGAPGAFDLAVFPCLQYLRLDRCPVSEIQNWGVLRARLKELRFYNQSIASLTALLANNDGPGPEPAADRAWPQLEFLAVVNSSLAALDDAPLALLPAVKTLRLGQNELRSLAPLRACANLQELDVSFNRLDSVTGAHWVLPQIVSLDLSHNALSSTAGLERLFTLEVLNLSHNAIASIAEVGYLVALPNLYSLFLQGNPVAAKAAYRSDVQKLLTNEVMLDGVPWASQAVDDNNSSSSVAGSGTEDGDRDQSNWAVVGARSVLLAIAAIVLAQAGVHLTASDSGDLESDQLLLRWLATLGAGAALVLAAVSALSWISGQTCSSPAAAPPSRTGSAAVRTSAGSAREGSMRRLSRAVSSCLVDEMYLRLDDSSSSSVHQSGSDGKVALDVLRTSLASVAESPEEMPLLVFLSVCSELQRMLALLRPGTGPRGGLVFASNVLARGIAALEATEDDLQTATLQESLLRAGAAEAAAGPTKAAVRGVARVLLFLSTFLLELTSGMASAKRAAAETTCDSDGLRPILLAAYRRVFASRHPWIVQRTVADAVAASTPSRSAFFAALRSGNERVVRNDRTLEAALRTCGAQLQVTFPLPFAAGVVTLVECCGDE
ncbi:hypothetical protein PybrP1_010880 [[Pythium] brassicae (nom. inval.)]|nr:hypothetical protein PybrP1_010880 [[Pythium] brassicae (nom. inval.)]